MTNKQTIDGVSRELIVNILQNAGQGYFSKDHGDELRALLDADKRPSGCCCPSKGYAGAWAAGPCPIHQGLRRLKPAAQPQCEAERLRADRGDLQRYANELNEERCEFERKIDKLRSRLSKQEDQLANQVALLREALNYIRADGGFTTLDDKIEDCLSASAEPTKQEAWALQVEKDLGIERLPAEPKPRGEAGTASVEDGSIAKATLSAAKED